MRDCNETGRQALPRGDSRRPQSPGESYGVTPGLATVLVGDDPASQNYVRMKHKDCEELGVGSIQKQLSADASQDELESLIEELNADPAVTGYIVQLPLPKHLNENRVLELVNPGKTPMGYTPSTWEN